jgi:hypothetical protein
VPEDPVADLASMRVECPFTKLGVQLRAGGAAFAIREPRLSSAAMLAARQTDAH